MKTFKCLPLKLAVSTRCGLSSFYGYCCFPPVCVCLDSLLSCYTSFYSIASNFLHLNLSFSPYFIKMHIKILKVCYFNMRCSLAYSFTRIASIQLRIILLSLALLLAHVILHVCLMQLYAHAHMPMCMNFRCLPLVIFTLGQGRDL